MTKVIASLVGALLVMKVTPAYAGPNEQRLAQALFDDARRLMDQKRYSEACPKLAESQRLDPGGGTLLNLAVCHAADGKTATALVEYNEALSMATRDGRRDREDLARTAITKLEKDVPRVVVVVPPPNRTPGLDVRIDDTQLPSVAWDVPMPVDPGSHTVVATVPGRAPWTVVISILEKEKKTIEIPRLAPEPEPAPAPAPAGVMPGTSTSTSTGGEPYSYDPKKVKEAAPKAGTNPVYVFALGSTIIAGGVMVVTGVLALSEQAKAEDNCFADRNWCKSQGGRDAADNAQTLAVVSTTALVIGAVGFVSLFLIPSKRGAAKATANGFALEGTF